MDIRLDRATREGTVDLLDARGERVDQLFAAPEDELVPTDPAAERAAQEYAAELQKTRVNLTADMLASMVNRTARLERALPKHKAWFFTIDGRLNGSQINGALFAGACIVIRADTEDIARRMAADGLAETSDLLVNHFYESAPKEDKAVMDYVAREAGGRRAGLAEEPRVPAKLNAIMRHIIGGEPWKF